MLDLNRKGEETGRNIAIIQDLCYNRVISASPMSKTIARNKVFRYT